MTAVPGFGKGDLKLSSVSEGAMERVGSLEEAARKRKERLLSLKRKQTDAEKAEDDSEEPLPKTKLIEDEAAEEEVQLPVSKKDAVFKNYTPEDEKLQEKVQPSAELAQVEEHIKDQLDASKPAPVVDEIDLNNLAPRKPDWDLKRDAAKKLEKLEKRTQRAIAELIRERLQSEGDLSGAVEAGPEAAENEDSD